MPAQKNVPSEEIKESRPMIITADLASLFVLFFTIIFLPAVTFFFFDLTPDVSKKFFLLGSLVALISLWLVSRLQEGEIHLPWTPVLIPLFLIPLSFLVSGLMSKTIYSSLVGPLYSSGTFLFILVLTLFAFLASVILNTKQKIFGLFVGLMGMGVAMAGYSILFLLASRFLPRVVTAYLPALLISKWYESGVVFGLLAIISLLIIELFNLKTSKLLKWLSISSLVSSLVMLALINFMYAWVAVGLVAILLFVYVTINNRRGGDEMKTVGSGSVFRPSFIVVLVVLLFITLGRPGGLLNNKLNSLYQEFNLVFSEVRPTWASSAVVTKDALLDNPIFGVGPNNFSSAWSLYRPKIVNELDFWSLDFNNAIGIIPTFAVTTGILGILAWLAFFGLMLYTAWQSLLKLPNDYLSRLSIVLSFITMTYLWVMSFVYIPDSVVFPLAFIFSGVFLASLLVGKVIPLKTFSLYKDPRTNFVAILVFAFLLISTITAGYSLVQKFWSIVTYQKALVVLAKGDKNSVNEADGLLVKAINLNSKDPLYYRTLANVKIRELNTLLSDSKLSQEEIKPIIQNLIDIAISSSQMAVSLNSQDDQNILTLGNVYEFLSSLQVAGAYDQAKATYLSASKANPNNPEILLSLARLEITKNNFTEARKFLEEALKIKTNYTSSILLLAQIDLQNIGTERAIKRLEEAAGRLPNDVNILFQLGFLRYRAGDYAGASSALGRVLLLSPNNLNANASYFLGLSYAGLGEDDKALEQFKIIEKFNPDNTEVKTIIRNINSGVSPLSGLSTGSANTTSNEEATDETTDTTKDDEE